MRRIRPPLQWLLLAALLAGCSIGAQRGPTPTTYRLELDPAAAPSRAPREAVLRIAELEAVAGVDTRGIAYRTEPHELRYYTQSFWTDRPARMLRNALGTAFETAGLFRGVVQDARIPADYLLTGQLLRLEQHVPAKNGESTVTLRLRLQLLELPERRLLGSRVLEARAIAPSVDAPGAVAASHDALAQVVADALRFVERWIEAPEPAG